MIDSAIEGRQSGQSSRRGWLWFGLAWGAGVTLAALYLSRGWVPHDEGTLAQSAERMLRGELPHRDFDEIYTGGLSALHALAFAAFGERLASMRLVLFGFFVGFLPAVYYVARRFVAPRTAALVTLVAAAWTLPNYSAPVPSWYNLFFATFGAAALLRHVETSRRRWLVAAGVAAGLSCLAKTPGLYFVAAALVFLAYREHSVTEAASTQTAASTNNVTNNVQNDGTAYVGVIVGGLALLAAAVALLVRDRAGAAGVVTFVLPVAALVAAIGRRMWSARGGRSVDRARGLARLTGPFLAGTLIPVVAFLIPYAASGALDTLWTGVFVLPTKRFTFASMQLLPLWTLLYGAALVGLFAWARRWQPAARRWGALAVGVALLWVLAASRRANPYEAAWYAARALLPLTVLAGAVLLGTRRVAMPAVREQQVVLLLSVTALCSLVQFPFAAPVYFCYVAPLALLTAVAVGSTWDARTQPAAGVVLLFYLLFALLRINPGFIYAMGVNYVRDRQTEPLALERAGVRVTVEDKTTYERAVAAVRMHARGEYIWAGPDAPEVYFLSGKRNPTRTLFDFFDSPADRAARVLDAIDAHDVRVIVLHSRPPFSGALPTALRAELERRFPQAETGGWFQVRWRE